MSAQVQIEAPPSVRESFEMLGRVRDRLRGLVVELDEVLGATREVAALRVVSSKHMPYTAEPEGVEMNCVSCGKRFLEKRCESSPSYGYHSDECMAKDG